MPLIESESDEIIAFIYSFLFFICHFKLLQINFNIYLHMLLMYNFQVARHEARLVKRASLQNNFSIVLVFYRSILVDSISRPNTMHVLSKLVVFTRQVVLVT